MACARQVAAAFGKSIESVARQGANPRLRELHHLSALCRLSTPDTQSRLLAPYRAAGISAAAIQQLETRAIWQLNEIARFAGVALERVIAEMSDWVINICVDKTGLNGLVRPESLNAKLCKNGFLKPVAEAITASWHVAITGALEECATAMPPTPPVKIMMATTHAHIIQRTPPLFARELLRWLDDGNALPKLPAMSSDPVNETLQALLQFQWNQLRQTCLDTLAAHAPGEAPQPQQ